MSNIFTKTIGFLFIVVMLFLLIKPVIASEATIYFFWATGCPHCAKEKQFLDKLQDKYPQLEIKNFEIADKQNLILLQKLGRELKADVSGVPFTVIGREYFVGYLNDETTGSRIEEAVKCAVQQGCEDVISNLSEEESRYVKQQPKSIPDTLTVPVFGQISVKSLSLPALTFIIAFLDGFNPCAMWALLFLISLLLGMKDRVRMWILGTAFIVASAFIYFLFMSAWLNLFIFLGYVAVVRIVIGLIALFAGGYYLRDYLLNKSGGCSITGNENRQRIFEKLRSITQKPQFLLALGGIILLAFAVNTVELICSAGLPAIYTQVLALSNLPVWQYYLYLSFYILIFLLDDLFIFFTAMITLQATGIDGRYSRYSHLIGGILMVIIGGLLLFKPELLMFV